MKHAFVSLTTLNTLGTNQGRNNTKMISLDKTNQLLLLSRKRNPKKCTNKEVSFMA